MTKKDYELIANAIKDAPIDPVSRERVTNMLSDRLKMTSDRFDEVKFKEWCLS